LIARLLSSDQLNNACLSFIHINLLINPYGHAYICIILASSTYSLSV
jgi:hypothetical protein